MPCGGREEYILRLVAGWHHGGAEKLFFNLRRLKGEINANTAARSFSLSAKLVGR